MDRVIFLSLYNKILYACIVFIHKFCVNCDINFNIIVNVTFGNNIKIIKIIRPRLI